MKVIQVYQTNPFENGQGGGVRYIKNLINGITNHVDEILFLGIGKKKIANGKIKLLPITRSLTGYVYFLFVLMIKLPSINLKEYDVVHVHRLYFAIPFIILKPKLKIVCTMHGRSFSIFTDKYGKFGMWLLEPTFRYIEKFCISKISNLVPVSDDVITSFNTKYKSFSKNNNSKITVASPIVDLSDYHIFDEDYSKINMKLPLDSNYIGFLGRLSKVKDIDFLIDLVFTYKSYFTDHNLKLLIYGNGERKDYLINLTNQKKISDLVWFYGEVNPEIIDLALGACKALMISSHHESGPIVMKEALICGIPVITNAVGETKDFIISGKNGYLVEKSFSAYFKSLTSILNNPIKKDIVARTSENAIKKSSAEFVSRQYLQIYQNNNF